MAGEIVKKLDKSITIRLSATLLQRLDAYRRKHSVIIGVELSRGDAVRKLLAEGLRPER